MTNETEREYETGDVVEFQSREGTVRGIIKYEQGVSVDSDYSVYVNKQDYANGYVYIKEGKIIGKLGHVDYEPQDPFQDTDELLAPFKTIEVECDHCGDTFRISEEASRYGTPDYCSESCGINSGAIERNNPPRR